MPNLILADDHAVVRTALHAMLEQTSAFRVVAQAQDHAQVLEATLAHRADLLLLDLGLPGMPLGELTALLKARVPHLKILVLTGDASGRSARQALAAGAHGYAVKSDDAEQLVAAMHAVLRGERYVAQVGAAPWRPAAGLSAQPPVDASTLTGREREVLGLACAGFSSTGIAQRLALSPRTVRKHRENLMRKLGVHNTAQLTACALQHGLVD